MVKQHAEIRQKNPSPPQTPQATDFFGDIGAIPMPVPLHNPQEVFEGVGSRNSKPLPEPLQARHRHIPGPSPEPLQHKQGDGIRGGATSERTLPEPLHALQGGGIAGRADSHSLLHFFGRVLATYGTFIGKSQSSWLKSGQAPRHHRSMDNAARSQQIYDHRLRNLVYSTGRIEVALDRGVPRSTARGWLRSSPREVVSIDELEHSVEELREQVFALRERNSKLRALLRLFVILLRISRFSLSNTRLPASTEKQTILRAVDVASRTLQLPVILRVLRLSSRRYHSWRNAEKECRLEDVTSCPRTTPHQLTPAETRVIKEMATSKEYRHVPTGTLAILAQRLEKVFASAATWYRLIRVHDLRRPRKRVHPAKPTIGIRASKPNEIWHVDTTIIRLLDGTRAYLHGVIDNFSRRILAWKVSSTFDPTVTAEILLAASRGLNKEKPNLLVDGGVENFNSAVDELVDSGMLKRVLAQTEISYSNSLIESWWRALKNQWLYLNTLDSVNAVESLVEFYVGEHNTHLPHSAFRGQTPDEIYFGTNEDIPEQLKENRATARSARLTWNQQATCEQCCAQTEAAN